ncbi:putative ATP-dependent helicase [Methanocella paludicola SANAE]|uniref:ATP-dependent helicase n=1 Tax=Methanocella paludicola (strain DSM 17711 / JCM 13418 / NBRC 101707 / SANAE) TaxID=304371 RepID=D1YUS9_METPS|nr:DEAD/DEAH box helicase [Methanocella paludicola]BAI60201.1 putative ATP-dependent helicase [Methanocella paludicola SANAE]
MKNCFELLDVRIRKALASMGFTEPTETQEKAIPAIMSGDDVLVIAPTGTGKTETAMLPALHGVLNGEGGEGFKVLYITPLRALNRDMLKRLTQWSKELGVSIEVRHGDTPMHERRKQALKPPDVLITTPETLQAIFMGLRMRNHLKTVKYVIVDEVHELASSKRGTQLSIALERLAKYADFQRIGLSATVGAPEEVAHFLGGVDRKVRIVQVSIEKTLDFHVTVPKVSEEDKKLARKLLTDPDIASQIREMIALIHRNRSTLMFVNTRQSAEAIGARFKRLGESIAVHHGSLSKEARIEAEDAFKDGRVPALVCTSSMELGIDIGDIDHVIQYMSPREVCRLVQRVGRAGHRVGETSTGTVIAINEDDAAEAWAITRRAAAGQIESVGLYERPYDALANQVCAMALEYGDVHSNRVYDLVRKAYPYRELSRKEFDLVLKQLVEERLIFVNEAGIISRKGKTRTYMYENLSMIPDEKRYQIQDVISGRFVGTLDEAFVINMDLGAVFITKGDMWRIVEITEDRVRVEPVENPQAEVPSWTGEEIPVPFAVAMEVGAIRRAVEEMKDGPDQEIVDSLMKRYPTDAYTARKLVEYVKRQIGDSYLVPTDKRVVVEDEQRTIIINACFGHKVNETLGRVITALLASRFGSGVAMEIDPYRIKLELPKRIRATDITKLIMDIDPLFVEPIIEKTLKNTMLLKWKMVHVARKFGALSRDVDYERISMDKLLKIFEGTPMYEEAVREIFHDKLDVENARKVLTMLRNGEISLAAGRLSFIGGSGFTGGRELMAPETADRSILMALKDRIMNDHVLLFCLNCKQYSAKKRVEDVEDPPVCPVCGSKLIAALKPWERDEMELAKHPEKLKAEDDKIKVKRVYRNANIVLSHGKKAVIALASRGLGPETASRVIAKLKEDEDDFYRDILRAERDYVRTRRFWV